MNKPIVVESPETDVFILLALKYNNFTPRHPIWYYPGKVTALVDHRR